MLRKRTPLTLLCCLSVFFFVACSDSTETPTVDSGPSKEDQGNKPKEDRGDNPPPKDCDCDKDQVCNMDFECVDKPEPGEDDVLGTAVISQIENEFITEYDGVVGRYDAVFWEKSDAPSWDDPRTTFTTPEGFLCYHDDGDCSYPGCNNFNVWLPVGLSAGDLTFTASGAPGPVVLEAYELSTMKWRYKLKEGEPGQLGSNGSWFDAAYVPLNTSMTLDMAGGDDFAAANYEQLAMPKRLVVTSPTPGVEPPVDEDLEITWDDPQAGTTINFEMSSGMVDNKTQINCSFRDSGKITIPKAELAKMNQGNIYMAFQRDATRYVKTETKDGRDAHLMFIGRFEVQHFFYEH